MTEAHDNFIQRMKQQGVARNSYYVKFDVNMYTEFRFLKKTEEGIGTFFPTDEGGKRTQLFTNARLKSIGVMCKSITLPGRELETIDSIIKPGWQNRIVSNLKTPEPITCKFYCSPDLNERRFIENWMNMAVDPYTLTANYYDEYAKDNTITIFCLPRRFSGSVMTEEEAVKPENGPIFFVKLFDCYPTKISETTLEFANSENLMELEVTFSYKYFKTITDLNFVRTVQGNDFERET